MTLLVRLAAALRGPTAAAAAKAAPLPATTTLAAAARSLSTTNPAPPIDDGVDVVVVGAGVVGLAVARAAALAGREVVLLEQAATFGTGTSSRHSEVVHAGIYYPSGSLKARLCVEGKRLMYEYCAARGVAHRRLSKLVVATEPGQAPRLRELKGFAAANGVPDMHLLSPNEARALEPELRAEGGALLSPSTGIVDSHALMAALLADAAAAGAVFATHSRVLGVMPATAGGTYASAAPAAAAAAAGAAAGGSSEKRQQQQPPSPSPAPAPRLLVDVQDAASGEVTRLAARWVVNAAGLHAQELRVAGLPARSVPPLFLAKGSYFSLACPPPPVATPSAAAAVGGGGSTTPPATAAAPFSRLIYPLPVPGGLGVHLTLDLAGAARFGPDVEWVAAADYAVDARRAGAFYPAVRAYWPGLPDGALVPAYSGVRPKVSGPGDPAADFVVSCPRGHGVPGYVALYGIESPGLTSSLALAREVLSRMGCAPRDGV